MPCYQIRSAPGGSFRDALFVPPIIGLYVLTRCRGHPENRTYMYKIRIAMLPENDRVTARVT